MELLRGLRSLAPLPARNRGAACKGVVVALVYTALVLDNILLTVVGKLTSISWPRLRESISMFQCPLSPTSSTKWSTTTAQQ